MTPEIWEASRARPDDFVSTAQEFDAVYLGVYRLTGRILTAGGWVRLPIIDHDPGDEHP